MKDHFIEDFGSCRCSNAMHKVHDKIEGWEVCQVDWPESEFNAMWFAARDPGQTWCDIRGGFYTDYDYIHADGIARKSLKNGESWSGYFPTREAVVAAIRR
jgi:hypothetical protein